MGILTLNGLRGEDVMSHGCDARVEINFDRFDDFGLVLQDESTGRMR